MKFKAMKVAEIAQFLGAELEGPGDVLIEGVAPPETARSGELGFAAKPKVLKNLGETKASAIILHKEAEAECPAALIRVEVDPYLAYARVLNHLTDPERPTGGVHAGAHVHAGASLAEGVVVMPGAYVGEGTTVGEGTVIYPGAVLMERVVVGRDCLIYPGAVVREDCTLGDRVILHANSAIGSDGFGFTPDGATHVKIPQVGVVELGDDVEVGATSCVDRAALGATVIGSGTKIDDKVMVGHGTKIGKNCILVSGVGVAGSTTIGDSTIVAGHAGVSNDLSIGANSLIYSFSHVTKSFPEKSFISGRPAKDHKEVVRQGVRLNGIEKWMDRVKELEKELEALKNNKK